MNINKRTAVVRKSHGESLVKFGEKIQESVLYALFVTPFLFFGKSLFEGDKEKVMSYIAIVLDGSDFLFILFALMSLAVIAGIKIKSTGYDLIEGANKETNT
ncbi:MAG: hypothetical protein ABJH06_01745 [Paraglaciecola sp.]|uniref:hypothetical protein n=1 Tax=Paraglaciecola sp. TaxID=1920173 RepID=UPI00329A171D